MDLSYNSTVNHGGHPVVIMGAPRRRLQELLFIKAACLLSALSLPLFGAAQSLNSSWTSGCPFPLLLPPCHCAFEHGTEFGFITDMCVEHGSAMCLRCLAAQCDPALCGTELKIEFESESADYGHAEACPWGPSTPPFAPRLCLPQQQGHGAAQGAHGGRLFMACYICQFLAVCHNFGGWDHHRTCFRSVVGAKGGGRSA